MQQQAANTISWSPTSTRTGTYADVMTYLHGIDMPREVKKSVGRQLLFEAENENQAKALDRLDYLSTLKENWDGYGAAPVSAVVVENLKKAIKTSRDDDWESWMISPATNGTLTLQSKLHIASISVGDEAYSYYSCINGDEDWSDNVKFSVKSLLKTMRMIV